MRDRGAVSGPRVDPAMREGGRVGSTRLRNARGGAQGEGHMPPKRGQKLTTWLEWEGATCSPRIEGLATLVDHGLGQASYGPAPRRTPDGRDLGERNPRKPGTSDSTGHPSQRTTGGQRGSLGCRRGPSLVAGRTGSTSSTGAGTQTTPPTSQANDAPLAPLTRRSRHRRFSDVTERRPCGIPSMPHQAVSLLTPNALLGRRRHRWTARKGWR